jgi:hypothetical protein
LTSRRSASTRRLNIGSANRGGLFHQGGGIQRNASAITNMSPTMTTAATAPAVILALSLEVSGIQSLGAPLQTCGHDHMPAIDHLEAGHPTASVVRMAFPVRALAGDHREPIATTTGAGSGPRPNEILNGGISGDLQAEKFGCEAAATLGSA